MSNHPDGLFMYGYALGGPDSGWKVPDSSGDEFFHEPALPEWMPSEARYDVYEFVSACQRRLLTAAGVDLDHGSVRIDLEDDVKRGYGVEFERHGYSEYPMLALVTKVVRAYEGGAKLVDLAGLEGERVEQDWDGKIAAALTVLGISPTQARPGWLVASYYG